MRASDLGRKKASMRIDPGGDLLGSCWWGWAWVTKTAVVEREKEEMLDFVEARRLVLLYRAADFAAGVRRSAGKSSCSLHRS